MSLRFSMAAWGASLCLEPGSPGLAEVPSGSESKLSESTPGLSSALCFASLTARFSGMMGGVMTLSDLASSSK